MSKRGNGEGYVYQNSRGLWIVRTQIGWLDNGRPKFKTFSGHTRKEALQRKNDYDKNIRILDKIEECTLTAGMTSWLSDKKSISLKPSSFARLKITVERNILPRIGRYYVSELTSELIQSRIITDMTNAGFAWSTIKKCYDALNDFYKQCIADRKVIFNPVNGVVMPPQHLFDSKETRALTPDEIQRFEKVCSSFYSNGKPVYRHGYGYMFILYTGIRSGEALALQYKHIDLVNKTLTIEQSVVCIDNDKSDDTPACTPLLQLSTKSASGHRTIPLSGKAIDAIKQHMKLHYTGNDEDFVFASKDNKPLLYRNFRKSINAVYKAAEIDAGGFHILRHTIASQMFAKEIDIKYISAFLGHSGVQITYDSYVHINKNFDDAVISKINAI